MTTKGTEVLKGILFWKDSFALLQEELTRRKKRIKKNGTLFIFTVDRGQKTEARNQESYKSVF